MGRFIKKLKNFIHKHETLEKLILLVWGIFCILRAKFIFGKIKHGSAKGNFKVIILALRTIPTTSLTYFDALWGQAFRKLGCQVKMLYCDGVLDSCDANTILRNQNPQCFVCKKLGGLMKNSLNIDCISYHQHISNSDIKKMKEKVAKLKDSELMNYEYLGINIGRHARASAIRYFLFGKLDLDNPDHIAFLREKLVSAMIATKVAESVVAEEEPNAIFMVHGLYSSWAPFFDYFRLKELDTIIHTKMPSRLGYFMFNRNDKAYELVSKEEWSNFSRSPLKKEERSIIDNFFIKRFRGEAGDQRWYEKNFDAGMEKQSLLQLLSKKKYTRRYVMYSNLAWDAAVEGQTSKIFNDVFSWIDTTIEFFKRKKDCQLIIKPHPAELIREGCSKGIRDYIIEKHHPLPENITLLEPNVPLRAYDLVNPETIAIVFNGTLGLEMAASGIPVLTVGDMHYKDAGAAYKVETSGEYLNLLDNPQGLISFARANIELAKKYAYFYYFKAMIRIPFYRDDKWATIDWGIVANTEKLLDDNSNIIKICKKIINKEDIAVPL